MPTKPTTTWTWNTDGTNRAAPSAGLQVTGYAPNAIPSSSHFNYRFFHQGEWMGWVDGGSSADNEDAHIVETDADGVVRVVRVEATGPSAGTGNRYAIQAVGGALGGNGLLAQGTEDRAGVTATGGPDGSGLEGFCGSNGAADRAGVVGTGVDARPGVLGINPASGPAIEGRATGAAGVGVRGLGAGTQAGVHGTGGSSGTGVEGEAGDDNATGVRGYTTANSNATAAGIRGEGQGDGIGVYATADDGYGVLAVSRINGPTRAALRIAPQDTQLSISADGDVYVDSTTREFRVCVNSRWQSVWTTDDGLTFGHDTTNATSNNNSGNYTTIATATLSIPYEPKRTGLVLIRASGEFGAFGGTIHTAFDVRIRDATAGVIILTRTINHSQAEAGVQCDSSA